MKPFVIFFPQFYPNATNDKAWGHGFTDWALVANANLQNRWARRAPLRGFYDGSSEEVHLQQINEINQSGLGGVGVYHYWFYTHSELARFERTLIKTPASQSTDWFLIWACEGWSKRWIGDPQTIIHLTKNPTNDEIAGHCEYLAKCFDRSNYVRVGGKPVFVWYNLSHFDRPEEVVERYKNWFTKRGEDIFTGHFIKNPFEAAYSSLVDFNYLFEPRLFYGFNRTGRGSVGRGIHQALRSSFGEKFVDRILVMLDRGQKSGVTYAARDYLAYLESRERSALVGSLATPYQEVISPAWNNTPRYGDRFTALESLSPEAFGTLVQAACARDTTLPPLVNAWNEWSEGAAVEPCAYQGTAYLDALAFK